MKKNVNRKKGFTLVEAMLGSLALAILSLTVGATLIGAWNGWHGGQEAVQMQQDLSFAMRAIQREIRRVPVEEITVGTSLGVAGNMFTKSGNDLRYQNTTIIDGIVRSFSSKKNEVTGAVEVSLILNTGDVDSDVTATYYSRN